MRMGIQGKLILGFMLVLTIALAVTCARFSQASRERLRDVMGEQAVQLATALSFSSERAAAAGDWAELNRMGQQIIKGQNILFVGYMDGSGKGLVLASRDLDSSPASLGLDPQMLMRVKPMHSAALGDYLQVVAPIIGSLPSDGRGTGGSSGTKLLGFVAVGISQAREQAQFDLVNYGVVGLACVMAIGSLPAAYLLVHRIFFPIRKLVQVSRQITCGDLDARVEIHRPDIIGELARSFDEMAGWVKQQQEELAHANAQLAEANRDLEQKIRLRTAQLETANTRLAAEIAEKDEFVRTVSHDLNAPLRNISGMATMLLSRHREHFDEEIIHRLERIKINVDLETDLIGELLELSRIKTRRQAMEPVDVAGLLEELRGVFESDLKSRSIEVIVDTPLPGLHAERARIRQVFLNLIDNAIKYMGEGAVREIHIGCHLQPTEAEFYVRDTGMGIDAEDVNKVFLVFKRGRNIAAQSIEGKGVGLASVKSIVETYNGRIWVNSCPGQGSTFRFTINGRYLAQSGAGPGTEPVAA